MKQYYDTVSLDEEACALVAVDQTRLPGETVFLTLTQPQEIFEAIRRLCIRGAPAIGVAAAIGLYVCACRLPDTEPAAFVQHVGQMKAYFASSRPTAVNLTWALERMQQAMRVAGGDMACMRNALHREACAIRDEDIAVCRAIGLHGAALLCDGDGVLTHCNAGRLAAVRYGTALAPVYIAAEQGVRLHVYADETRPLLQGARLTAYELLQAGVPTTLLCDNMAASMMASGRIQAVFVGCDRVAANGDTANKIGTAGVAVLANYYHIPFYVCAPMSTIDPACRDGSAICIEQREGREVTDMWYRSPVAPAGVTVYNPAFDVTDHTLITAMVTEHGVLRPPFHNSIAQVLTRRG